MNQNPALNEQSLHSFFMQSPAIFCLLQGAEHVFVWANEPYRKLTGQRSLIGKPLRAALPELCGKQIFSLLDEVYLTRKPYKENEVPLLLNQENGQTAQLYLNLDLQPVNENGNDGILVFAYDVTEQVESRNLIRESEAKYCNLLTSLPFAVYTCNSEGYVEIFNEAAEELWGRKPAIGKDQWCGSWELYQTDGTRLLPENCALALAMKTGNPAKKEMIIRRPDGSRRHVISHPRVLYNSNGNISGAVNSLIDITEQANATTQLLQTMEMIETLYMNAPAFICTLKGPDCVYDLINPEYQKLYGTRKLKGLKILDALPELKNTEIKNLLDQVYETGIPYVGTELLLHVSRDEGKEPEPTYFNFSYQPMYDLDKKIDGILVFGYEVTEQVLARQKSDESLKRILEELPQIISISSASGTNIYFNNFFYNYSGISKEEASIHGWNSILHKDEIEGILRQWEECKKNRSDFYREIRLRRSSDNMYRWHISRITAIKNKEGEVTQWIATATDIHEQKTKEEKKDEFISIASHELKTPVTSIKAYLQLLEITLASGDEKALLYTRKAILSVNRLSDLIGELLDVSKIQNGKLVYDFSTFDFNKMVDESIEGVQYNSPLHQVVKTGHIAEFIEGDRERICQVIINLLNNAVKYSPSASEVSIHVEMRQSYVTVAVKDYGIGITKDNLTKIFDRYFRVENQELNFHGLGIGLFISMEIIQQHGGRLWAESEPGKGSTFYFSIPPVQPVGHK
jgi:PAS domain S-box-containing protein